MSDVFVPVTKNPPAKVKDPGIVSLVLSGAGVYSAKGGEVVLLPRGMDKMERLFHDLLAALLKDADFQPVDAQGADAALFSLAERYVREYKENALFWSQKKGRDLDLQGWQGEEAAAYGACEKARGAVTEVLKAKIGDVLCVTRVTPGKKELRLLAAETEKTAEGAEQAFRCAACGTVLFPDSAYLSAEPPAGAGAAEEPLADVHTPGTHTIQLLCEYLKIPIETTLKAMLYTLDLADGGQKLLFAMIRGDRDISIPKLASWVEDDYPGAVLRRAESAEIVAAFGEVAGFCGPVGVPENVQMVADFSLKEGKNFVVGGNRPDYHRTGCCWGRDFEPPLADLALIGEGIACPKCGGALKETYLRPLGEFYAYDARRAGETLLQCRDRDGAHEWPWRVRGTISLLAVLLAIFEKHTDDPASGNNQEVSL